MWNEPRIGGLKENSVDGWHWKKKLTTHTKTEAMRMQRNDRIRHATKIKE